MPSSRIIKYNSAFRNVSKVSLRLYHLRTFLLQSLLIYNTKCARSLKKKLLTETNNAFYNIEKVCIMTERPIYTTLRLQTTYRVSIPGNDIVRDATCTSLPSATIAVYGMYTNTRTTNSYQLDNILRSQDSMSFGNLFLRY